MDEESPGVPGSSPGWWAELSELGRAFKQLLGAQWALLLAEIGLARSAVWLLLMAGLAAMVAGVGFGLTVLALVGVALAKWWGSWLFALLALALLQLLFLLAASVLFRRCLHWLSLPRSREHGARLLRDSLRARRATGPIATPEGAPAPGTSKAVDVEAP
jgi:hypothetical protein